MPLVAMRAKAGSLRSIRSFQVHGAIARSQCVADGRDGIGMHMLDRLHSGPRAPLCLWAQHEDEKPITTKRVSNTLLLKLKLPSDSRCITPCTPSPGALSESL